MTLRAEYEADGLVRQCGELSDSSANGELVEEARKFEAAARSYAQRGVSRVPYFFTPAIERVVRDTNLIAAVAEILGEDEPWVAWGPNIRESTPNEAHRWHVDLESWIWPGSITAVIGLAGCEPHNATRCIPGSQRLNKAPHCAGDDTDSNAVVRKAQSLDKRCGAVESFAGFRDGRFYLFDARCWHQGDPRTGAGVTRLFIHYQRACEPRVPHMADYQRRAWLPEPSPFIESRAGAASQRLSSIPWRERLAGFTR